MLDSNRQVTRVTTYEVKITLDLPVAIFCMVAEVLASATFIFALSKRGARGTIVTGFAPSEASGRKNAGFFLGYARVLMAIVSLCLLLFELLIIIRGQWFTTIRNRIIRGVLYLLKGIAALGCVGNLGIAAGSFEIISAAVLFVIEAFFMRRASTTPRNDGFKAAE